MQVVPARLCLCLSIWHGSMPNWRSIFQSQPRPDSVLVAATAGLLEIPEFRLFQLAYRDWYGSEPGEAETETWFEAYMFADQVPFWVRYYCERIQRCHRQGILSRTALGIKSESRPPRSLRWFVTTIVVLSTVLMVLVFLADQAAYLMPFLKECYFPPCY